MEARVALQLGALRDALEDAGATREKAARASEELAGYENRLASMDTRLTLLTWMVAGLYAIGAPVVWLLIRVAVKVGAI
jgi:hypothetical protein